MHIDGVDSECHWRNLPSLLSIHWTKNRRNSPRKSGGCAASPLHLAGQANSLQTEQSVQLTAFAFELEASVIELCRVFLEFAPGTGRSNQATLGIHCHLFLRDPH